MTSAGLHIRRNINLLPHFFFAISIAGPRKLSRIVEATPILLPLETALPPSETRHLPSFPAADKGGPTATAPIARRSINYVLTAALDMRRATTLTRGTASAWRRPTVHTQLLPATT